jgi:hypothetical protein
MDAAEGRPSPWWPTQTKAQVFLIAWLVLNVVAPPIFGTDVTRGLISAALWYFIIVGVRALMYPKQRPAK